MAIHHRGRGAPHEERAEQVRPDAGHHVPVQESPTAHWNPAAGERRGGGFTVDIIVQYSGVSGVKQAVSFVMCYFRSN